MKVFYEINYMKNINFPQKQINKANGLKFQVILRYIIKDTPWTNKQENLINLFLENLVEDNMYAFD